MHSQKQVSYSVCDVAAEFTLAPEEWIYEPVLVDRWGFLAKTILILERLKGTNASCMQTTAHLHSLAHAVQPCDNSDVLSKEVTLMP